MKPTMSLGIALLFLELFFAIANLKFSFCNGSSYVRCIESERKALLKFKQDLHDPLNRLDSWIGDGDCCKWDGIFCDDFTGHVLELRLRNPFNYFIFNSQADFNYDEYEAYLESQMVGKLNPSLLELKHLTHLDLSGNDFQGIQIPKRLGFMEKLRYLNLSRAGFSGMVPHQLGNLSNLGYLDLSDNGLYGEKFSWLSNIFLLQNLDLSFVNLSKASDLSSTINLLASLKVLKLSACKLHHFPPLSSINFSSLTILDLSLNNFQGSIPNELGNLTSIKYLDLSLNHFNSTIPNWFSWFSSLEYLSFWGNELQGPIPNELGNLTSIKYLDLSLNHFNSTIPDWFSRFSGLEYLSLSDNSLQGMIPSGLENLTCIKTLYLSFNNGLELKTPRFFEKLSNLRSIDLSGVKLTNQEISQVLDSFPRCVAFQLESLKLSSCQLSGHLTNELGQFKNLHTLDLSFNKLNGTLSEIHFVNLTKLTSFDVSENSLILKVNSSWVPPFQLESLGLSSCHLGPKFPSWLRLQNHLNSLHMSNTRIIDTIPNWFWKSISQYQILDLSHNHINGEIPNLIGEIPNLIVNPQNFLLDLSSNNLTGPLPPLLLSVIILDLSNNALSGSIFHFICGRKNKSKSMKFLKLSENLLSGEIPDCWNLSWSNLIGLNLSHNKFTGNLPISMGSLNSLQSLNLRNNRLSGAIPMTLKNCTELVSLDMGGNEFVGNIPTWIGESFSKMLILNFRSNKFHGQLPTTLCHLTFLQILDLAYNNLSGTIPICIKNFNAMTIRDNFASTILFYNSTLEVPEDTSIVMKGAIVEFNSILNLVRSIDISKNYFSGHIPSEVTNLEELQSLNLSHNSFTGKIPDNMGAMKSLESLDFSENQLEGEIPQSFSSLTFLSYLNLSNNNLSGKIPLSTQLQSLDSSGFIGNNLCGSPLPKICTEKSVAVLEDGNRDEDLHRGEVNWFYVSLALGFVVGFWFVIGPLLVSRNWRYKYYRFLDHLSFIIFCFLRKCC